MHPLSSLTALVALSGFSSAEPNGWSKTKEAPDSPTKLDDCGCWPIYQAILRCQDVKSVNDETRDCVCIENPDGWYPFMDGCRNCLSLETEDDGFFDNIARLVTQLFVSCTNAGGGVYGDGNSICASNAYREACVSLGTGGRRSWASIEVFDSDTKANGSYVLDIEEYGDEKDKDTSTTGTAVKTTATTTAATTAADSAGTTETSNTAISVTTGNEESTPAASGTSDDASETETGEASATAAPSSAAGRVAGVVRAAIVAVVVGAVLF